MHTRKPQAGEAGDIVQAIVNSLEDRLIDDPLIPSDNGRTFLAQRLQRDIRTRLENYVVAIGESGGIIGVIGFSKKPWETALLDKQVASIDTLLVQPNEYSSAREIATALLGRFNDWASREEVRFSIARTHLRNQAIQHSLQRSGFDLIEVYVSMSQKLPRNEGYATVPAGYSVREMTDSDIDTVYEIARVSFSTDRLHWDARIPNDIADKSRAEWVVNSYRQNLAKVVYVAEQEGGRVIGFVTGNLRKDPEGLLGVRTASAGLMAVHPDARGKDIGRALINRKIRWAAEIGLDQVELGTQLHNPSLRLYESCGYKIISTGITFHKHEE